MSSSTLKTELPASVVTGARARSTGAWRWLGLKLALALLVAICSTPAFAQNTGRVDGIVHDQSGAVIPGASVTLRNEASGTELKAKTDNTGVYSIDLVPPATYTLTVQVAGFKTYSQSGLAVHPADRLNLPVGLELGQQVQMVEVTGQAAQLVTTDSGAKTDVIGANQIQNLATEGRNAMELLTLLPGVVNNGFNVTQGSSFDQGVGSFNINGLRNDQNDIRMDNAHMIDPGSNGGFIIEPNMDMIQEFSLKGSSFEADQGRSGLIIDTVTKSGGNKLHGEVYYYGRNAALNANDWSNNDAGLAKPTSKFNYPGFNIGGPVRLPYTGFNKNNDKMFFFFAAEWQRQFADPGTELATVPTERMRTGDFGELLNAKFCTTDSSGQVTGGRYLNMPCLVTDPNTGKTLPGNMLPPSEVTQNGEVFLKIFPLPTPNFVDPTGRYNFAGRPLYAENRNEQTVRVDYNLTENTRAFVRLAHNAEHHFYPYGLWSGENSGWTSNIPEPSPTLGIDSGQGVSLNLVKVINPTLTNEFQFNMQALNLPNRYQDPSKMSSKALGFNFKGFTFNGVAPRTDTVPQVSDAWSYFGGNPGAGRWGEGDIGSRVFADKTEFEWLDNVTKVHGTHTIKFGVSLDRTRNDQNGDGFQAVPEGGFATDASWGNTTGNEFGDLLTEHLKNYGQASNDPDGLWRFWDLEAYAQDSWKVTRRLTLNYGARFSWLQPWYESRGHVSTFDPTKYDPSKPTDILNGIVTAEANQVPKSIFPNPSIWSNLQPRLGFAYDLFGTAKTVVRGGFGTYVTRDQGNIAFFGADNIPFVYSASAGPGFSSLSQIETTDPFGALGNISLTADNLRDNRDPQTYEWNFTLSQSVGLKTTLEASYVGNVSRHLVNEHDANAVALGGMWKPGTQVLSSTTTQGFRYYQPFGNIYFVDHSQTANYNSLQVTARRNVSRGLTLLASYTWSKTLGYATAFNNAIDPFDSRRDYGLLNYDRAHILNFSYIYQLPNPGSKYVPGNRWAHGALDDWQISGITHFTSGAPLRVGISGLGCKVDPNEPANSPTQNLCGNGVFTGDARTWLGTDAVPLAVLLLTNPQYGAPFNGVKSSWLNPLTVSLPNIGKFGTYDQPTFRGPGSNEWNMTLFKTFPLGEKRRLEFRFSGFDIFNRASLDNPDTSASFNWQLPLGATSLSQGRAVLSNPTQFGYITDKHGHREIEAALKIYF